MDAYKKEVWFTIIMSIILVISGHLGIFFSLFPVDGYLFGFPIMYIVPILVGWFGVLALTIISGKIGNHIDEAIERENQENTKKSGEEVI
jgi:cytochrome b subunit of formate dehydrogenase